MPQIQNLTTVDALRRVTHTHSFVRYVTLYGVHGISYQVFVHFLFITWKPASFCKQGSLQGSSGMVEPAVCGLIRAI